jgi:hypothetical protein
MREAGLRILALTGAALFVSGAALAQTTPAPSQDDRDKIVCRSERIVGSHLSERVCRSKSEWDAARYNDKHVLDRRNGELRAPKPKGNGG